jgi:anti-anti-sigma regulatory factor
MLNGVILSMEGVNFIDTEGADIIMKITQAGKALGIDLHLARVKPQVLEVLQRDGVIDQIGDEHIHDDIAAAVELHLSRYAPDSLDMQDS